MIVEDEILVAANLEATLEDLGYEPIGIAPDMDAAMSLADAHPDLALVDVNLRDGETGAQIGARLSRHGVAVLFLTANPRALGAGVPGTLGVVAKPYDEDVICAILDYALKRRDGAAPPPPPYLTEFNLPRGEGGGALSAR